MKRLSFCIAGVILTIAWIVYTAPPLENKIIKPHESAQAHDGKPGLPHSKHYSDQHENEPLQKKQNSTNQLDIPGSSTSQVYPKN